MRQGVVGALSLSIHFIDLGHSMVEDYSLFVGESVYKSVPSKYGSESQLNLRFFFAFTNSFPERGRPSYYSKDLYEFQTKRASFTDAEERDKFIKERQALVIQMEKVMFYVALSRLLLTMDI